MVRNGAMISKEEGNAPRATDLKKRNKSSASLINESPFGTASYSLSTVTHARVTLANQHFVHFYQDTTVVAPLYAA
jgi:hypothetical protein